MNVIEQKYPVKKKGKPFYSEPAETTHHEAVEGPLSVDGLRVSEEAYWERYYHDPDFTYEWNNGVLEEKPMADYLSFEMYRWFFSLLQEYLKTSPIARMIGLDIGFRLALSNKTSIRRPDLALILYSNPMTIADDDCTYQGIFDLCIEFLSDSKPGEAERDTVIKKQEYSQIGVREYFILDRKGNHTAFYHRTRRGTYSPIPPQTGGIIRSEVLPGFQFRIEDLYTHPSLIEKINDSVYNSFILPEYQAECHRAEAEHHRAEAERQEKLKFAAKLRELGIPPESL